MSEKITVPTLGESVTEATVSKWLKSQGDKVIADEPIVELETDKVNVEVPSPSNGVLGTITVKEGQTVKLILKHIGKAPIEAMGHNVVILAQGTDFNAFANASIDAKENGYIPKGMENSIIAKTDMIGGGQTAEITFAAPAKGSYDFLCSFPGHYIYMKGKFIVE